MAQGRAIHVFTSRDKAVEAARRWRDDYVALLSRNGFGGIPTDVKSQWWPLAYEHQQEETQR